MAAERLQAQWCWEEPPAKSDNRCSFLCAVSQDTAGPWLKVRMCLCQRSRWGLGRGPCRAPYDRVCPPPAPGPGRKQALKSKSPGPPIPPARESQQGGGASLSTRGQKALHVEEAASPSNPRDPRICRQVQSLLAKQRVCSRCYILSAGL